MQKVDFHMEMAQTAERAELTGWVKNAENGSVVAQVQGFESRIHFLIKFLHSLKHIKIKKIEHQPHSFKQGETDFRIL